MNLYYKRLLGIIFVIMALVYATIVGVGYKVFRDYALLQNQIDAKDLLMHSRALRLYLENTLKPVIYQLQNDGKLSHAFFDAKILSTTYISRQVMKEYNKQRKKEGLSKYIYKIASDNPRNPINKANTQESKLLKKFNDTNLTIYIKHVKKNTKEYIYYAMPVLKTKRSCMRCHSSPELAPKGLIDKYGSKAGFGEHINVSRAIVSLAVPFDENIRNIQKFYRYFVFILSAIFILVFIIICFFINVLDKKDKKLKNKAEIDGLTNVYNRYKFNKDIERFVNSQRDGDILHLAMLDIDHFKNINDKYGHSTGDMVLQELCSLISENIRPSDRFYRVGGEEFTIVSFSNTYETELEFTQRIRKIVQQHRFKKVVNVTISLGFTQYKKDESSVQFYERCDRALYNAKENGRDRVESIIL